jgi:hypothetical protein
MAWSVCINVPALLEAATLIDLLHFTDSQGLNALGRIRRLQAYFDRTLVSIQSNFLKQYEVR